MVRGCGCLISQSIASAAADSADISIPFAVSSRNGPKAETAMLGRTAMRGRNGRSSSQSSVAPSTANNALSNCAARIIPPKPTGNTR